jgi:hypothetical protein
MTATPSFPLQTYKHQIDFVKVLPSKIDACKRQRNFMKNLFHYHCIFNFARFTFQRFKVPLKSRNGHSSFKMGSENIDDAENFPEQILFDANALLKREE